jgi:hypothetical protein
MSYIYADTSDGVIRTSSSSLAGAREASSGTVTTTAGASSIYVFEAKTLAGRGGSLTRYFTRSFFWFDTSSVTDCTAVSLELYGFSSTSQNVQGEGIVVLKSDAFGGDTTASLASTDFDNIVGWDGTSQMTGATHYSAAPSLTPYTDGWSTTSYNSVPLGSGAQNDINNNNYIIICCVSYKYDYLKADPTDTSGLGTGALANNLGCYHSPSSGNKFRPRLNITHATSIGKINGVAFTGIAKVNSVAKADIGKIISVD